MRPAGPQAPAWSMSAGSEHRASAAPGVVPAACAWKVGPRLSCRHLLDRDLLTKSDPSVALLLRSQGQWVQVGWARAGLRGAQEPRWAREASGAQGRGVQALRERGTGQTARGSSREALQVGGAPGREGRSSEGATQDPVRGSRATEKHSSLRVWAGGSTKGSRREWGYRAWYSSASLPSWEPVNREGAAEPGRALGKPGHDQDSGCSLPRTPQSLLPGSSGSCKLERESPGRVWSPPRPRDLASTPCGWGWDSCSCILAPFADLALGGHV